MTRTVKWSEDEYKINYSKEWEQSIEITYWEHDIENKWYIIKFIDNSTDYRNDK